MSKKIILASKSPRRCEILRKLGIDFEIVLSDAEEITDSLHYTEIAMVNAIRKADAVAAKYPDTAVIGADTVIELDGKVLGKPSDIDDAKRMLRSLSGRKHHVVTGVCVRRISPELFIRFADISTVEFKKLSDADIENYLSKVHVLDKAGAYAVQEHGDIIIKSVEGSVDNVIGLPGARLAEALRLNKLI